MKLTLALAAIVGLTLAPAANAQVSCADVRRLIMESEDDFDGIAGKEIDDDLYEATYKLRGASDCSIDLEWDSIYSCLYQTNSYMDAGAIWAARLTEVSGCLSGWKQADVPADATATDGYRTMMGKTFTGSGDYEDLEWAVVVEEHTENGSTHYHVWVDLAYYW